MTRAYKVGHGKPPMHTRFRKGQSGNPKGRQKGAKNLSTELTEELKEVITIKEDGVPRRISKRRAIIKSITAMAMRGNVRAAATLFQLIERALQPDEAAIDDKLSPEEQAMLNRFLGVDVAAAKEKGGGK